MKRPSPGSNYWAVHYYFPFEKEQNLAYYVKYFNFFVVVASYFWATSFSHLRNWSFKLNCWFTAVFARPLFIIVALRNKAKPFFIFPLSSASRKPLYSNEDLFKKDFYLNNLKAYPQLTLSPVLWTTSTQLENNLRFRLLSLEDRMPLSSYFLP